VDQMDELRVGMIDCRFVSLEVLIDKWTGWIDGLDQLPINCLSEGPASTGNIRYKAIKCLRNTCYRLHYFEFWKVACNTSVSWGGPCCLCVVHLT
jgi:hypothetical protein